MINVVKIGQSIEKSNCLYRLSGRIYKQLLLLNNQRLVSDPISVGYLLFHKINNDFNELHSQFIIMIPGEVVST